MTLETLTRRIDSIATHRFYGFPLFLAIIYCIFALSFYLGNPLLHVIDHMFSSLGNYITAVWPSFLSETLRSLVVDGIISGVGGVVIFLPNILLLFMGIAILEFSGYMDRAALVVDRLMHKIGLHGSSFMPMIIGFGCSVPAILAARSLKCQNSRMITILVMPLISCGGRLPIYSLLIAAFFKEKLHAPIFFSIYMIGVILAIIAAKILSLTILKPDPSEPPAELTSYRLPSVKAVLQHMWERAWLYLRKAGTIILGVSIILWVLNSYPKLSAFPDNISANEKQAAKFEYCMSGRIGKFIEPVLKPMGFDWKIGTALIGALAVKEAFVSQIAIINALGDKDADKELLSKALRSQYTPLTAFCLLLFCLIGFPCVSTIAVVKAESGKWKWAIFQFVGLSLLAWIITTIVYQAVRFITSLY